ncbi:hypothetical protein CL657_00625 [bacterium]|nr:hypothetical protein [bacterium]
MYEMAKSLGRMVSLVIPYKRPQLEKEASSSSGPIPLENTPQYQNKTVSYFEEFFTLNKKVVIRKLKSRPELNDTEGTVVLNNNNKRVIKNDGIIRVVVKTVNGDTILIKPANLFYDTAHKSPAQGIVEDDYELTDGSPIYNCLGEFVGMHNSVKNPDTKRVFFSDDPSYREVFESVGVYLTQNC